MPIVDLYSSRQKQREQSPDVWQYDAIPNVLRVQVYNLVNGAIGTGEYEQYSCVPIYQYINRTVAHEHGRHSLARGDDAARGEVLRCIQTESNLPVWLDVVELSFRFIERVRGEYDGHGRSMAKITITAADAIEELNERFRRAGFGYRYEAGKIIRLDNEFLHQEATRPALTLLSDPKFSGADEEFRAAHEHLKNGEFKDCAVDALNALESTMKAICDAKGWKYQKGARATDLLKVLRANDLFPEFADGSFDQLIATLKSGLPALRNEAGAHGQGALPVAIPVHVATYALNLAASKICFLVEAYKDSERKSG